MNRSNLPPQPPRIRAYGNTTQRILKLPSAKWRAEVDKLDGAEFAEVDAEIRQLIYVRSMAKPIIAAGKAKKENQQKLDKLIQESKRKKR